MYLGPDEQWPKHPRPMPRAALERARQAGWWFEEVSGHGFGRIRCRPPHLDDGRTDACKVPIWSSSGSDDGSTTARAIDDQVRKCPHQSELPRTPPDPEASARLASGRLAQASALILAAEALIQEADARKDSETLLNEAISRLDRGEAETAEELERRAGELEEVATAEQRRAYTAALRADAYDPWPPADGARELATEAKAALDEAEEMIEGADPGNRTRLVPEHDRLREALQAVSTRL